MVQCCVIGRVPIFVHAYPLGRVESSSRDRLICVEKVPTKIDDHGKNNDGIFAY